MSSLGLTATDSAAHDITLSSGPTRFFCRLAADPAHLRTTRHAISRWAEEADLPPGHVDDLALAVGEAVSNSIEHAYPTGGGQIEVDGHITDSELQVVVTDHGGWRTPGSHPGWRGRGIALMRALTDHTYVERGQEGTTVSMSWKLPG